MLHVHWNISRQYGLRTTQAQWKHQPEPITETERVKILWDFEIRTDHHIPARRPDIIIVDKEKKETTIIDVAVPDDMNIEQKEREKISKYQDLRLEIQKLWNTRAKVVPIVIGALGVTTNNLKHYLEEIPGDHHISSLLKAALLGSAYILRKTLNLPESW